MQGHTRADSRDSRGVNDSDRFKVDKLTLTRLRFSENDNRVRGKGGRGTDRRDRCTHARMRL